MIMITKEEAARLRKLFPELTITRTAIQRSKRHRYYATEAYEAMKAISDSNAEAAEIVAQVDKDMELRRKRYSGKQVCRNG